jgi:hypothetical protein
LTGGCPEEGGADAVSDEELLLGFVDRYGCLDCELAADDVEDDASCSNLDASELTEALLCSSSLCMFSILSATSLDERTVLHLAIIAVRTCLLV